MRSFLRIIYWPVAVTILAVILVSLDYTLSQAVLIALMFCPCALVLEFWMPKARKPMDKVYLSLAVMSSVILLIVILHFGIWTSLTKDGFYQNQKDISPMLINPAFLGLILTTLSIGDYFWVKWISLLAFLGNLIAIGPVSGNGRTCLGKIFSVFTVPIWLMLIWLPWFLRISFPFVVRNCLFPVNTKRLFC